MTRFISIFAHSALLALLAMVSACGGASQQTNHTETPAQAQAPVVAAGEAKPGDRSMCPVSKDAFTIKADSPSAEYQGKTYYFCCPGCKEEFVKDPAKYLTGDAKAQNMKECAMPEHR
jgi:YHS domain-containing protein